MGKVEGMERGGFFFLFLRFHMCRAIPRQFLVVARLGLEMKELHGNIRSTAVKEDLGLEPS